MGRLDGKVALISGGARGQGAAEAMLFAKEGAKVVIGDLLNDEGKQVEAQIAELGGDATYVQLDVTSADDWDAAVQTALERYGRLDILVNNAGILGKRTGIEDTSSEQWDAILDVNAKGVFLGTKAAIPALQEAGGGSIVNISSIAGIIGSRNGIPAYQASKGAVRLLTKSTALQHAADNIRCNSVHPGMIVTAMTEETLAIPEMPRVLRPKHPARQVRHCGRHRQRRAIPGIRRFVLCNRQRTRHRRRISRPVN